MASKVLLTTFLLACVGVCYGGRNRGEEVLSNVCTGDCPEYEMLCSTPEYDVRRYKSALWVSTTTSDVSLSQGTRKGQKRILDYFKGANDHRLKMSYTAPLVTQTLQPSESQLREITVSMPLPKKVEKNPPKPADPTVVIDLVPETIMYVKRFVAPRVGFVADLEAKNFFKTLATNKEPFQGENDYYYVFQYESSKQIYIELAVFALNERIYKWLEFNDLTEHDQLLPTCLRNHTGSMVWEKMDQSDIPLLTREQCSTTYCEVNADKCAGSETSPVKGIDDRNIQLKRFSSVTGGRKVYNPPTCYFDTAIDATARPRLNTIYKPGFWASGDYVTALVTTIVEKREELDGENGCQKFFRLHFPSDGRVASPEDMELTKEKSGFLVPETVKVLHDGPATKLNRGELYFKCLGGNVYYEPSTLSSTAKMLMGSLRESGTCFLGDHFSVVEYHSQSRLFDRYNQINVDVDKDCSDQDGRPLFTFPLPLSKGYSRSEEKPSLGDQCITHECANTSVIMRLGNNLKMFKYTPATWFYSKSPSMYCSNRETYHKALNPLLSYLNGKNEDNLTVDMSRPVYGKMPLGAAQCKEMTTVSTLVPAKLAGSPPKPIDENVWFGRLGEHSWIQLLFKGKYGPSTRRYLDEMLEELDMLKPFGVEYNTDDMWLGAYDGLDKEERLFEIVIQARKNAERDEEQKEEGKMILPKPEGCNEQVCPAVYIAKNHSNYMEVQFGKRRTVCHRAKLCGDPLTHGRKLLRPLFKYLNGDNSANEKIKNASVPYIKVELPFAEDDIGQCEREYQVCAKLPDEYEDKEIPSPKGKGLAVFETTDGYNGYGFSVKGTIIWRSVVEATSTFMRTLDDANVPYDKSSVGFFTYNMPFDNPEEVTTYFFFVKEGENLGEESGEADTDSKK